MILKEIVDAALGCYWFGSYHAALVLAFCAVEATAKQRYPNERDSGRRFKDFMREAMPILCGAKNLVVAVDAPEDQSALPLDERGVPVLPNVGDSYQERRGEARMVRLEGVLYHAYRCSLSHEGTLKDVSITDPHADGSISVHVKNGVHLSADIIGRIINAVATAPENAGVFPLPKRPQ